MGLRDRFRNWHIRPYFKWFDFWVGLYWDSKTHSLYIGYFPTLGIKIHKHTWMVEMQVLLFECHYCKEVRTGVLAFGK